MVESQEQVPKPRLSLVKVIKRWNIKAEDIPSDLEYWLMGLAREKGYSDSILTYYHSTWGSCRRWKVVIMIPGQDGNIEYPPGEWLDASSNKNTHKYKFTRISDIKGRELEAYVHVSPSCNQHKEYSYRVRVVIND